MSRFLKIYTPFTKAGVQISMTYRFNFFAFCLEKCLNAL